MPHSKFNRKHQRLSDSITPHRVAMGRHQQFQARRALSSAGEFDPKLVTTILKNGEVSIPVADIFSATARAEVLRMLLRANQLLSRPEFAALKAYLAFIHQTLKANPGFVRRVRVTVQGRRTRNSEGHYNVTDREVVLSAGFRSRRGAYHYRSPQEFLGLMVHEYTHVLDFVARAANRTIRTRTGGNVAYTTYINAGGGLAHASMRRLLNAMTSRGVGQHYGHNPSLTFSEILARFSELGAGRGTPAILAYNLYLFANTAVGQQLGGQQQDHGADEDEQAADRRAQEMLQRLGTSIDEVISSIAHDIVNPFIQAVDGRACGAYFMELLLTRLPQGTTIYQQGYLRMVIAMNM